MARTPALIQSHDAFPDYVSAEHINWTSTSESVNTSGSGTFTGGVVIDSDANGIDFGAGTDMTLSHDGTHGQLALATGGWQITPTGGKGIGFNTTPSTAPFVMEQLANDVGIYVYGAGSAEYYNLSLNAAGDTTLSCTGDATVRSTTGTVTLISADNQDQAFQAGGLFKFQDADAGGTTRAIIYSATGNIYTDGTVLTDTITEATGDAGVTIESVVLKDGVVVGLEIGTDVLAQQTVGIANDNLVEMDDLDAADNDYAKFTADGLEGMSYSEVKSDLSLDNVENTALSTWAGTASITTLGTITTGIWQGTAVADGYVASAATWNGKIANVSEDASPELGGDLDCNGNTVHFGSSENTQTPTDPATATIDLGAENHHTLNCGSAVGAITLTLTVPPGPTAGTIIIEQDATARDVTWSPSAGTVKWLGTEPTWDGDASKWRVVSWRWDGTYLYLSATETD